MEMSDAVKEDIPLKEFTEATDTPTEPGHDAWFREKVTATLKKIERGEMKTYTSAEVRAKFGM